MASGQPAPVLFDHSYRLKAWKWVLPMLFLLAFAAVLGYGATSFEHEVTLKRVITVSPTTAGVLSIILAAVLVIMAASALLPLLFGVHRQTLRIRVTGRDITAPVGAIRQRMVTVPLQHVFGVGLKEVNDDRMLLVGTALGTITIARSDIGTAKFEELSRALAVVMQRR